MKKLAIISSALIPFLAASQVFADDLVVQAPTQGYKDLGAFIGNIIQLSFVVALILVLVMLVLGAFEWISSGGDKEAVGKARGRILNALIGLAVLAIAFALFRFAGQFLGFNVGPIGSTTINLPIPSPR